MLRRLVLTSADWLFMRIPRLDVNGLLVLAALGSCGDGSDAATEASRAPDAGEGCQAFVSDSLIEHACFHELMGPHQERTAGETTADRAADVDRPHTAFHVRLPALASGGYRGRVSYQARIAGEFAVFTRDGAVSLMQHNNPQAPKFTHRTEICQALPEVAVYALQAQAYTLEIASDRPDVALVIEFMNEGAFEDAYRIECDESTARSWP
jgi:hypothetical protein